MERITKKPLDTAPPWLQRMLLQLQKYNLKITHSPGKSIPLADTLSQKYIQAEPEDHLSDDFNVQLHAVIRNLPVSDQKIQQLQLSTSADPQLQTL